MACQQEGVGTDKDELCHHPFSNALYEVNVYACVISPDPMVAVEYGISLFS